ncbi:MAG: tRNA pseudouridine(38-40) synthase TruA [Acidobacteria bacterium]|nr:tRNA pseudouridine(38-40) synthase TruA [Acidobacteriota bacterium]MCK6682870.1 tRNA pseudouridine(38-40) synthase TruA [Thermoanaerobaculia bacterium]
MRYRLDIAYLGTRFAGWQIQPGEKPTVQGEVARALSALFRAGTVPHGSGRTDTGVHAEGQVAHFDLPEGSPVIPPRGVQMGLNTRLPEDIRVTAASLVPPAWHARFDAVGKRYRYRYRRGSFLPPHAGLVEALLPEPVDVELMRRAAGFLAGTHDFRPFALTGGAATTYERTLTRLDVLEAGAVIEIVAEADGFLRGMVRRLAGTLRDVGRRFIAPEEVWRRPGPTAEARGLTLEEVFYGPWTGAPGGPEGSRYNSEFPGLSE